MLNRFIHLTLLVAITIVAFVIQAVLPCINGGIRFMDCTLYIA